MVASNATGAGWRLGKCSGGLEKEEANEGAKRGVTV